MTAITLAVTTVAVWFAADVAETKDRVRFENFIARTENDIRNRLETYVDVLRAGSAFVQVAGPVDRIRFERYVTGLDLQRRYPGIQGIAVAAAVEPHELDSLRSTIRQQGFDLFDVRPPGPRELHVPVVYLAPLDRRNQAAIGFDMFSEPVRRRALEQARDSARPVASGRLILQQEIDEKKQAGFVIYLPLYRGGEVPATVGERRRNLEGFIAAPFRADDLLRGIFGKVPATADLQVFDGATVAEESLLHDTRRLRNGNAAQEEEPEARFAGTRTIEVEGRIWTLRFTSRPEFEQVSGRGVVPPLLVGGILVTIVMFALTRSQAVARIAAEQSAAGLRVSEQALRASEDQLRRAKEEAEAASRAKDRFLAVLSHELRTPLTPVLTALDLLVEDDEMPETLSEVIAIIKRNVELEAHLIDDMLDLTRITNGKLQLNMTTVDIHEILPQALAMSQAEVDRKKLVVHFQLFARRHRIRGDAARLQQIFWNLLSNAVKFTPERGTITIRSFNTRDGELQVEVEDTGIGIEPELLPRIFNAFEQGEQVALRSYGGLGLGLAISRMLVDLHGGRLVADSEGIGHGSIFRALFPHAIAEDGTPAGSRSGARILIVEDHADTSRIMKMLLDRSGYQVHTAASVAGALELAEREHFDLLISDIGLPDGNGLDLMRRLNSRSPVRGIAMSGYGEPEDIQRSRDAGYEAHMVKPVNLKELYDAIHLALEEREEEGRS